MLGLQTPHANRPRLHMPRFSAYLATLSDVMDLLEDKEAYVIYCGKAYVGEFVAWRCPCQTVTDIERMTAVPPPEGSCMPDNCMVVSRRGTGISKLSRGDYDDDKAAVASGQRSPRSCR